MPALADKGEPIVVAEPASPAGEALSALAKNVALAPPASRRPCRSQLAERGAARRSRSLPSDARSSRPAGGARHALFGQFAQPLRNFERIAARDTADRLR